MSDVVQVAIISGAIALLSAVVTHLLSARAQATQVRRVEAQKEADRKIEREQNDLERHERLVRDVWSHVLKAETLMLHVVSGRFSEKTAFSSYEESPVRAAGDAYVSALLGPKSLIPAAREYYRTTGLVMLAVEFDPTMNQAGADKTMEEWREAFLQLEQSISELAHQGANTAPVQKT